MSFFGKWFRKEPKYQLVLQFSCNGLQDYDWMIELEDELIEELKNDSLVDGHDAGCGEMNIFIITKHPEQTFEKTKVRLRPYMDQLKAGYRALDGDSYTVLHPPGLETFDIA